VFGIYAHIPFCVHRCSYCDFYSDTRYNDSAFAELAKKLIWESGAAAAWLSQHRSVAPVTSVFFGGGTPSLMPMDGLAETFSALQRDFAFAADAEITLEANPETVSPVFAELLLSRTPVNRVSLGAQSFQAEHLAKLERLGSAQSIQNAVRILRSAGLTNYSLDLIFGIPGQTPQQLVSDIDQAMALQPNHLSFYSLTLKPGHKLYSELPCDDQAAELYEIGAARLATYGLTAYEISNFSRPGFESRHNLLYWSGGDFLGLGPSAATRFFWDGSFHHRKQVSSWERYLKAEVFPDPDFSSTNAFQTVLEATFLELRKRSGIDLAQFEGRYGYDLRSAKPYALFQREGMLEEEGGRVRLSPKGWLLAEGIAERLVEMPTENRV
jgi:putative oxygen-independent coproporphyrinogen III oxidase